MGKTCAQIDVPQLSLVLLTGLLRSDFPSEKSYLQWKIRQVNWFNYYCYSFFIFVAFSSVSFLLHIPN